MEPLQILMIVLILAGIWAIVELALTIRRARSTVGEVDKAVGELNETLAETRPVVAKLDGALDELTPALSQVEPLLKSANIAVDALSANLVEVEAVVRDVAQVTGSVATAQEAVAGVADSASGAVQRILGKIKSPAAVSDRVLKFVAESAPDADATGAPDEAPAGDDAPNPTRYYTYEDAASAASTTEGEDANA